MIAALLDHLWQSTLFAAAVTVPALLLRRQAASMRFFLWLAASLKFLLPFSALVLLGRWLLPPLAMPGAVLAALAPAARPFSATPFAVAVSPALMTGQLFLTIWAAGTVVVIGRALWHMGEMRALLREAVDLDIAAPVPVRSAASFLEPGLVGIRRPVILLPEGLARNLSRAELDAVLAHELCHLARRDNVTAVLHMLVEAVFWFHPLVWWIGRRLVEERERACDESVLAQGNAPLVYAQSILKICRYYVQTPLACAPGMSGPDLNTRLAAIMAGGARAELPPGTGPLLAAAGAATILLPIAAGMLGTLPVSQIAARMQNALTIRLAAPAPILPAPATTPPHRRAAPTVARTARAAFIAPIRTVSMPTISTSVTPGPALATPIAVDAPAAMPPADEMVCRPPQLLPGSRFSGPTICKHKSEWAAIKAAGQDVAPDGSILTVSAYERASTLSARSCTRFGPGGATTAMTTIFNCF